MRQQHVVSMGWWSIIESCCLTKGCTFEGHSNVWLDFVENLTLEDLEEESFAGCLSLEMNERRRHPDII